MEPEVLSALCGQRYLYGDHMLWIVKCLNEQQSDVLCIYLNYIRNVKHFVEKTLRNCDKKPEKLVFIMNIGKERDYECNDETYQTFFGSYEKHGDHFSCAVVDLSSKVIQYGDSLGWPAPKELERVANDYCCEIFQLDEHINFDLVHCHIPGSYAGSHRCTNSCSCYYPLQKDGNICGVVAITMAAIATLSPTFFDLVCKSQGSSSRPFLFISDPTRYSRYLRATVMAWFADSYIDINYLTPEEYPNNEVDGFVSDSEESEEEYIVHVSFDTETTDEDVIVVEDIAETIEVKSSKDSKTIGIYYLFLYFHFYKITPYVNYI